MNDPEYRGMMIEVFKEPEIQKEMADALKSKEYREHLQKVISETIESPLFKAKIQELLLKAAKKQMSKTGGKVAATTGGDKSDPRRLLKLDLDTFLSKNRSLFHIGRGFYFH